MAGNEIKPLELERAKRLLQTDYIFSTETPSQLAGLYGYYELLGRFDEAINYPGLIAGITEADLRTVIRLYLLPETYAGVILEPAS